MVMVKEQEAKIQKFLDHFDYCDVDDRIFLPNEIFKDFNCDLLSNTRHRSFAYAYYYLICYLYRNVKFMHIDPVETISSQKLMEFLWGSRFKVAYVVKREGVLEQLGYTISQNDYPIGFRLYDSQLVGFEYASEVDPIIREHFKVPPNFVCKRPVKAFYREPTDPFHTGTFFSFENTHTIPFTIFAKLMCEEKDKFELFYLYGFLVAFEKYINSKNKIFVEYAVVSVGFCRSKTRKLLNRLTELGLIKLSHARLLKYVTFNF